MSSQTPESDISAFRALAGAILTYTAVTARQSGLSIVDIAALEHLQEAGELTPTQLGARLSLSSGTITALVDRLELAGFVERVRHPRDRRSWLIQPKGADIDRMRAQRKPLAQELALVTASFSEGEREIVARYLTAVAETLMRHSQTEAM